jgi:ParB family transcriptional regulator, chromosome partitioning protein
MSKRGGLGRGLSALIPGAPEAGESTGLIDAPVNAIAPNPKQPRTKFDDETIAALAASIREVGILQPIVVRRAGDGRYELIAGERRLRAAKAAGLATVPIVLRESDDADLLREALIENIHREDLNPIEQAEAFKALLGELGLKQEELAERVGVSRSHIANTIRLLGLLLGVQQLLTDDKITAGHARALLTLGDADAMSSLGLRVAAEDLSVRQTEEAVRRFVEAPTSREPKAQAAGGDTKADSGLAEVEEILSEQLATRVSIQMGAKRGKVVIEFGSPDDLERIVSEIVGSGPGLAPD